MNDILPRKIKTFFHNNLYLEEENQEKEKLLSSFKILYSLLKKIFILYKECF